MWRDRLWVARGNTIRPASMFSTYLCPRLPDLASSRLQCTPCPAAVATAILSSPVPPPVRVPAVVRVRRAVRCNARARRSDLAATRAVRRQEGQAQRTVVRRPGCHAPPVGAAHASQSNQGRSKSILASRRGYWLALEWVSGLARAIESSTQFEPVWALGSAQRDPGRVT